jgi:hypothetical protein
MKRYPGKRELPGDCFASLAMTRFRQAAECFRNLAAYTAFIWKSPLFVMCHIYGQLRVRSAIRDIRSKLEADPAQPQNILIELRVGYRLVVGKQVGQGS